MQYLQWASLSSVLLLVLPLLALADNFEPAPIAKPVYSRFISLSSPGRTLPVPTTMTQDENGFIWLGTQHGLFRHDGTDILEFKADPSRTNSLSASWVSALAVDPAGLLWVGTRYGGLNKFDPATERFTRYDLPATLGAQSAEISSLRFDAAGLLWVATYGAGLFRWQNNQLISEPLPITQDPIEQHSFEQNPFKQTNTTVNFINDIYFDASGATWLSLGNAPLRTLGQQNGGVLYRPDANAAWQRIPIVAVDGSPASVTRIRMTTDGQLWATTYGHGLYRFEPSQQQFVVAEQPAALRNALLSDIWVDGEDGIWLSSYNSDTSGGLWQFDTNGQWTHYPFSSEFTEGLSRTDLLGLFADHQGTLWTISHAGVRGLSRFAKAIKTVPPGALKAGLLPAPNVLGVDAISANQVWLANRDGGVVHFNPITAELKHWPIPDYLPALKSVHAIRKDAKQQLWVGTNSGLYLLDPQKNSWQLFSLTAQDEPSINIIYLDRQQNLWLGSRGQGLFMLNASRDQVRHFRSPQHSTAYLRFGDVNNILEDHLGAIWIGSTDQGVARFDPLANEFQYWLQHAGSEHGLQMNGVQLITEDAQQQLWLRAGNINHRVLFNPQLSAQTQVFKPYLQQQDEDEFLQQAEVFRLLYRLHWLPEQETYIELDEAYGMQSVTWIGAWDIAGNVIYRGGAKGFDYFDITELPRKVALNPVQLTGLSLFNQPVRPGSDALPLALAKQPKLQLNYDQDMFSLRFASPEFKQPQLIQYRYRLTGFDRDWIQSSAQSPVATYTRLPPGAYQFEVSARLPGGKWLPATVLPLDILPPWWLTWWFRLAMLVTVIALVAGLVYWKLRHEYQVRRTLELLVAERTTQLAEQNKALAVSYQQLQQTQQQLITQEKMASLGGLVAGVAHEINTPLGVCVTATSHLQVEQQNVATAFANRTLQQRQFERFLQHLADGLKILQVNTQRAAELVNSFKQVSVDQSSDSYRDFDLSQYLHDVILSLSARLKKQHCQVQLVCPQDLNMFSDPGAIAQIITNLVINALLHGLENQPDPQIKIEVIAEESHVVIRFADNGCGMSEEHLHQLFEPFFTTKRNQGGSGLGAHIVFNLVTVRLHGEITVSSKLGQGLQYVFRLPRVITKTSADIS